jgi:RNA ligase (TIGR02306 family)
LSEFHVEAVRIGEVTKHPNADSLSITNVHGGYPVVFRTGDFQPGDLAVYVPVDAVVPTSDPRFAFLGKHNRIRAARLRGTFSMGLLVKPDPDMREGQNVQEALGITKWEPVDPDAGQPSRPGGSLSTGPQDCEANPDFFPLYTDLESIRKWNGLLQDGEEVVITEKIHGCNARFLFRDGRLWVGSRRQIKSPGSDNVWNRVAGMYDLEEKLSRIWTQCVALYGEIYGDVQDLKYGTQKGELTFRVFDAFDTCSGTWWDHRAVVELANHLGLEMAPLLYHGPWSNALLDLAEGQTTLGGEHTREGIVIRPTTERWQRDLGRVVLKLVGQGYLLRKAA